MTPTLGQVAGAEPPAVSTRYTTDAPTLVYTGVLETNFNQSTALEPLGPLGASAGAIAESFFLAKRILFALVRSKTGVRSARKKWWPNVGTPLSCAGAGPEEEPLGTLYGSLTMAPGMAWTRFRFFFASAVASQRVARAPMAAGATVVLVHV